VIHHARPGGGQDQYALELVNRLSADHQVTLFAQTAVGLDPEVRFVPIEAPDWPPPLQSLVFRRRAQRYMENHKWDIVHTIGGALPGASVITVQYCHAASLDAERRWPSRFVRPLDRRYRTLVSKLSMREEQNAATHPALRAVIAVSRRTAAEWTQAYASDVPVTVVIPNGVDLTRFRPTTKDQRAITRVQQGLPKNAKVVLTIGALVRKGIDSALHVLAALPSDVHLLAVGAGPHSRILAAGRAMGLAARLHLVHHEPAIERCFRAADIFLFPTRYEPFGMVIAEAWATGVPVVASGVTGALEWATADKHALVVDDPTDVQSLTSAVTRILRDPTTAETLAREGRTLAHAFRWERIAEETAAVYRRVVEP
jgi:glycosyltransferase involved in cell wall biosynthesis